MCASSRNTLAAVLIFTGAVFLFANITGFNVWSLFWPAVLIGGGLWVITRQGKRNPESMQEEHLIAEINRRETGMVRNADYWLGIGDVSLDLTSASFPAGVTTYRVSGLVGDIDVQVPATVGVRATFSGLAGDLKVAGQSQDIVFGSGSVDSPNYASAERKLHIEASHVAGDIAVHQVGGV